MYRFSLGAIVPVSQKDVFQEVTRFDIHLNSAPSVYRVDRKNGDTSTPRFTIHLRRFGTSGTIRTQVITTETPTLLTWRAERPIAGRWYITRRDDSTSHITIELFIEPGLIDRLPLGVNVVRSGVLSLLRRTFRKEVRPVLESIVSAGDGDPSEMELTGIEVERIEDLHLDELLNGDGHPSE